MTKDELDELDELNHALDELSPDYDYRKDAVKYLEKELHARKKHLELLFTIKAETLASIVHEEHMIMSFGDVLKAARLP